MVKKKKKKKTQKKQKEALKIFWKINESTNY